MRFFGSGKDTGQGDIRRLEACIRAGSIDEVYMITRWNGHVTTQTVRELCKKQGIRVHLLDSTQRARRKGMAASCGSESE